MACKGSAVRTRMAPLVRKLLLVRLLGITLVLKIYLVLCHQTNHQPLSNTSLPDVEDLTISCIDLRILLVDYKEEKGDYPR